MPKLIEISAKTIKDFVQFKGEKKGELLNCSPNLYVKRRKYSNGRKTAWWVFRSQSPKYNYQFAVYESLTLHQARLRVSEILLELQAGNDPKADANKKALELKQEFEQLSIKEKTFGEVAQLWFKDQIKNKKWKNDPTGEQHAETNLRLHILPVVEKRKISSFSWKDVYDVMVYNDLYVKKITAARKCRAVINNICNYACSEGWMEEEAPAVVKGPLAYKLHSLNVVADIDNHPALPYEQIPEFFKHLQSVDSIGARALEFTILTASRQGQIVKSIRNKMVHGARWEDFDLANGVWHVPASTVKSKKTFDCYLSSYVIALLEKIPRFENCPWVFSMDGVNPISNGCMLQTIKRMNEQRRRAKLPLWVDPNIRDEYGEPRQVTTHGTARSTFKTWASSDSHDNCNRFNEKATEMCLAHLVDDGFGGAYGRAKLVKSRKFLMEAWGRFCYTGKYPDE